MFECTQNREAAPCIDTQRLSRESRVRCFAVLLHSTLVLRLFLCFTCPAITVVTVILWALDRVRGRALGWPGPGSPKSQPHQCSVPTQAQRVRGVAKPVVRPPVLLRFCIALPAGNGGGAISHDFATAVTTVRGGAQLRT